MAEGGEGRSFPQHKPHPKFSVYQNPAFSAALTAKSLQPSKSTVLLIVSASAASATALLAVTSRENALFAKLRRLDLSDNIAGYIARLLQIVVCLVFVASLSALIRSLSFRGSRKVLGSAGASTTALSKKNNEQKAQLSNRQLGLLGIRQKSTEAVVTADSLKKPSKPTPSPEPLVPIRTFANSSTPTGPSRIGAEPKSSTGGKTSPSPQLASSLGMRWLKQSLVSGKGISTEEMLEQFLTDVDKKMTESAARMVTPPPMIRSFGLVSPSSVTTSSTTPGATRSTPLRPVRMSPGSHQKYSTPPKKGEGELPSPMTMEHKIEVLESLGIYPFIEQWHDNLRQWFSSLLLNPLLEKIETTHIQVMQAATKVGMSITVKQVGSDSSTTATPINVAQLDGDREWQPTFTQDEDGLLHQLRAFLLQARDVSKSGSQMTQQNPLVPIIQACLDAVTEHQRLHALMKGELVKGLLPQSSVRADYTVKRVRELAEGTCVKNYEYGEVYDKGNKKWTSQLPTDSHLLSYLFCVFLDHPKWMLHIEPTSYSSNQSSKNPLFLGVLPPKDRFPEKYVAIISFVPTFIHPGACILVVGKQSPPVFALYWDKKLQLSLQGRTALWDALLLLCHRIKVGYGGIVRGVHLGSSAFNILPVLDTNTEG
uniref:Transmembrane protein 209 n=1 Tax=Anthurium amnicola TaxID=1678845 RepID=A0A1D1ZFX0_9ARAE